MCALFGSANRDQFVALAHLNGNRGSHSHSVFTSDVTNGIITSSYKSMGEFSMPPSIEGDYYHGHIQAPTTASVTMASVHPSALKYGSWLWHNGILFDSYVKELQKEFDTDETWDTDLLHRMINRYGLEVLSKVRGSFACVYYSGADGFHLFRNKNCPLFTDGRSYSSTEFPGSKPIDVDRVYRLSNGYIIETPTTFKTAQEFFWSPE